MLIGSAALTWPFVARAQQKPMPVIGFLSTTLPGSGPDVPLVAAFRQGLSETGYVDGQNVAIEYRWAEGRYDRLPELAADLVGRKVDLIATLGGPPSVHAAKNATSAIPIVFVTSGDPIEEGLIASLARPGGNLTGVSNLSGELVLKRLELLSELVPQAKMIALLVNPKNPSADRITRDAQEAARVKGVQLPILKAATETEIDATFATLVDLRADALVVANDSIFYARREQLVDLATKNRLPTVFSFRDFVDVGGLASYGPILPDAYRQAGISAGKILKGAKPADLPVQRPTKFELVINLKTAKAFGLTVTQSLFARADEVIE